MHVPPLHSHHTVKLLASSGLLKRLSSAICASVVFLVGALCPTLSHGQVTHLSTTTGVSATNAAITVAHTTSAASNRLMLVGISHTKDDPTINSVTYGGVALTALGTAQTSDFRTRIYRLTAPASGTANVVVTFSARPLKGAIATVSTYSGVNQTTPLGTLAAASGDSTTPSVAVTSVSGDLVHDVLATETGSGTITAGAGQTQNGTAPADVGIVRNRSSRETATAATTTMSYSMTAKKWSISGVAIKRSPTPTITASGSVTALSTTYGTASPATSFTVSGSALTGNLTVAPPAGFETSLTAGSGYGSSTTLTAASGTVASTTVYVRLAAATARGSSYSGNISIAGGGATQQTIAVPSSTVAAKALTVTAAAASKASGGTDPSLTYSSDGLLAGGSITGSLARASGETTGTYPITQGTLSAGSNYTISFTAANFVITGLKAMPDSIQKPSAITALKIPMADLLANDGTLGANGEVVAAPNLTVTAAQTSLGAALAIRGQFILFLPTTNGEETLTYTVSNGTATSTATVTLTGEASAPPFSLAVIKRGTAAFSGGYTSVTHDFLGVPNQTYRIQYTTDLSSWTTAPDQSSGSTGSFSVTFTQSGDLAAAWNSQMFFRATKP